MGAPLVIRPETHIAEAEIFARSVKYHSGVDALILTFRVLMHLAASRRDFVMAHPPCGSYWKEPY